jgi:uncharacterized protein YndB with AHSA1/START domain
MNPVKVSTSIAKPREEVWEYLVDIANMSEFTDHFLRDWHLTRENPRGEGAGARFRVNSPLNRFSWSDLSIVDVEAPFRIVARGSGGKMNRIRQLCIITLTEGRSGNTTVEWTWETIPAKPSDRIMEIIGGQGWWKRRMTKGIRRLKTILEQDRGRGQRVTVAGG